MKKFLLGLALIGATAGAANAVPISISTVNSTYTQNFDGLNGATFSPSTVNQTDYTFLSVSNGTNAATLQGFEFGESGTAGAARVDGTYTTGTGSSNIGDSFNFGNASDPSDRAFGVLNSASLGNGQGGNLANPGTAFGFVFTNDTGVVIDSLDISYRGENYRFGGSAGTDRLDVQVDRDGDSLFGTNFNNVNAADYTGPTYTAGTATSLDGNAAANVTNVNGTFAPVGGIGIGKSFVIRFVPIDKSGADDGLAVDDLSIKFNGTVPTPEPSTYAMFAIGMLGFAFVLRRRKAADLATAKVNGSALPC